MAASREEVARAIRERNGSTRASDTPSLTTEEVGTIVRKLSFSGAAMDEHEVEEEKQQDADQEQEPEQQQQEAKMTTNKVQIVIRLRPLEATANESEPDCFRVLSDVSLLAQPPKTSQSYRSTGTATSFHFSRIFRQETQQTELFEATTRPVLDAAFDGNSGLVFAYGVTNSGKTYTISGSSEAPGVLPQSLQYVMDELPKRKEGDKQLVTRVTATYLEIYNENVYDLLSPALRKRRALRVQDCDGKIQVRGAVERPIKTLEEGLELLEMGRRHKQMAETNYNSDSSRSHCVFTLHLYHQVSRFASELRTTFYDLDGRLKKRRRQSPEAPAPQASRAPVDRGVPGTTTTGSSPPPRAKTNHRKSDPARHRHRSLAAPVVKPRTAEVATSPMESQREVVERNLHWAKVELENEELRQQLAQAQAEKMQMEVSIRAEIGNEMREQLQQIRAQYQSMSRQQREELPSARKKRERQHAEEAEKLRAHVQELREKVRECEDEIQRIYKRHQAELDKLQPKHVPVPVEDEIM
ncbi:hypothetical protein PC117_g17785 [Phytophthora cactorum]|uniref:Kinesin motor domain-containing protein n=1 Tax=Phytophthora cactorum TaxID=29920 RepID=A0A8T1C5J8_9STRA|nr:hypothetical protein PC117_g17785 [Phytophthora cactorum]